MSGFTAEKEGLARPADIRCLTGGGLKFMGVVLMVFDHLHQMFFMFGVPDWFTWIGRLVAPLFLFMCAEGFHYTRNRKRYMLLLFAGFEFMNLASHALRSALPNEEVMLINNIFGTLFLCAFYMWMVDMLRAGIRERKPAKVALAAGLTLLSLLIGIGGLALLTSPAFFESPYAGLLFLLINMIPNVFLTEGGFALVLLGVLFYVCREKRLLQVLALVAIGLLTLLGGGVQWMMIFAAVPILLYNGARGRGNKYFFYVFYPAHIYIFYTITSLFG